MVSLAVTPAQGFGYAETYRRALRNWLELPEVTSGSYEEKSAWDLTGEHVSNVRVEATWHYEGEKLCKARSRWYPGEIQPAWIGWYEVILPTGETGRSFWCSTTGKWSRVLLGHSNSDDAARMAMHDKQFGRPVLWRGLKNRRSPH